MASADPLPGSTRLTGKARHRFRSSIVGGAVVTDPQAHPWQVLLKVHGSTCGGSLIRGDWVLTAAHCVFDQDRSGRSARSVGFSDLAPLKLYFGSIHAERGEEVRVTSSDAVIVHPEYCPPGAENTPRCAKVPTRGSQHNDVALVRLPRSVLGSNTSIQTIAISDPDLEDFWIEEDSTRVKTTGWGLYTEIKNPDGTSRQSEKTSEQLREAQVLVKNRAECRKSWSAQGGGPDVSVTDGMLCAGSTDGNDSCAGDSGGPLIVTRAFKGEPPLLVGVVSWGPGICGSKELDGIYARVSHYRAWIDRQIGN